MNPDGNNRLEGLRRWFARRVASPLQGVTFESWRRLLRDERLKVDEDFRPRAVFTGLFSRINSRQARAERRRFGERIEAAEVREPIFILGHYRHGTTHLHNLFAADRRLACPSYHDVSFPHALLVRDGLRAWFGARLALSKRPHDGVAMGFRAPAEDELALCASTFFSSHMGWHFPSQELRFRRYLTFRDATGEERRRWKKALGAFARKLTVKYVRRLVFKSPCHTARIPLILETFPDARFIHIHRDPYRVYQSTRHMEVRVGPYFQFQHRDLSGLDEFILWRYRETYDAFLADRDRVPDGRITELSYDDLVRDPIGAMRRAYRALDLPGFEAARPRIEHYLDGVDGYRRNEYPSLDAALRGRIGRAWAPCFEEWGYPA